MEIELATIIILIIVCVCVEDRGKKWRIWEVLVFGGYVVSLV